MQDSSALRDRLTFSTVWLISLENWSHLHPNFITDTFLDKEVHVKFWKSSASAGVRIRTPDVDRIRLGGGLRGPSAVV